MTRNTHRFALSYVPSFDDDDQLTYDTPCVYDIITSMEEAPLDCCTPDELFDEGE